MTAYLFVSDLREAEGKSYLSPHEALVEPKGPILCLLNKDGYLKLAVEVERTLRELAYRIAEDVLPLFEKKFPDDKRPREAIETARRYNAGQATMEELAAARDTAWDATREAAREAAREPSWDATREASWVASWDAAWDATRDAAWKAVRETALDATMVAARAAATEAARDTAWDKYNRWIDEALLAIIERIPEELALVYLIANIPIKEEELE